MLRYLEFVHTLSTRPLTAIAMAMLFFAAAGCSNSNTPAVTVTNLETRLLVDSSESSADHPALAPAMRMAKMKAERLTRAQQQTSTKSTGPKSPARAIQTVTVSPIIASTVTFSKNEVLNRVFLYGSDLQYSSIGEADGMLLQSIAIGHVTTRFQILGDRLQLVAEEKYRFESDINIPLRLVHEWPIVSQTATHITVDIATASPTLASLFGSTTPARTSWIRSVEFVPEGSYLLIESSIELADGTVVEFME
ncbi:MAG: hypothetical protein RBT63_09515, partial [Bdellovibrionales bacterium]|nr:hypothetical protein [Bdellovibrionales bacterium]